MNRATLALGAILTMVGFARSATASSLECQIGLLTPSTLAGNDPATGEPWKAGDKYRFAFHTSEDGDVYAASADIAWYDAHVQALADASTAYPIGKVNGVTWRVIGSTETVDARDHTSTNTNVDGTGYAIFSVDGRKPPLPGPLPANGERECLDPSGFAGVSPNGERAIHAVLLSLAPPGGERAGVRGLELNRSG